MGTAPASLAVIAARVDRRLRELLESEIARWTALDPELTAPLESLASLVLSGGKRLRPAFCQWGWVGSGGDPEDPVVADAGAAFELLHAFALVHDDVMDGSDTRRGARTAHLDHAARHAVGGWRGEARRYGEGVAILIGDLAFVYADQCLGGANAEAQSVWNELRIELNIGQYLDVVGTARGQTNQAAAGAHRAVQVRQVHRRATAASRRGVGGPIRRAGTGVVRVRTAPRRRVPATRRHARRVRRFRPHRQTGGRRPPRGQTDANARDRGEPRASSTPSSWTASALPTSARTRSPHCRP